ncbi:MAG TPA: non-heme iron oxygenase ferredoxin subunit [Rhodanobacteraceae bacterium]
MSEWIEVGPPGDLLPGEFKLVWDGDTPIAVYNIDGDFYAIEDTCTHDGGDLAGGEIFGCEIECPRHGGRFDVRTGQATQLPPTEPIASFPVKQENGKLYTRDDRFD